MAEIFRREETFRVTDYYWENALDSYNINLLVLNMTVLIINKITLVAGTIE